MSRWEVTKAGWTKSEKETEEHFMKVKSSQVFLSTQRKLPAFKEKINKNLSTLHNEFQV